MPAVKNPLLAPDNVSPDEGISLGELDHDRGLPGIGDPPIFFELDSGQVLQASGDVRQTFNANPEKLESGIAILVIWTR